MARRLTRGDVWLYRFAAPDKRRPVLVLTRQSALDLLDTVVVAWVGSTRRGLPSEVLLDASHGMKSECAVNLDHVFTVRKRDLKKYVTTLAPDVMTQVCRALAIATGCR
jgi:mRNA interferase MazF